MLQKPDNMKKIFTLLLVMATLGLHAQTYNNEWIDFSKTYYKFKIGATGLYRIPQSVLANAGLGAAAAQNFQLFRNGKEIPIYTSAPSGPLGASDYIEFYGEQNDGKPDVPLYFNPAYQHTDKYSLIGDTAMYFLTVNPSGNTFHYANATNDTTGNVLPSEPYFMYKLHNAFRAGLSPNPGFASYIGEYVYSSSYDIGEFWSTGYIYPGTPYSDVQYNLNPYTGTGAPDPVFRFGATGCAPNTRTSQFIVNGVIVKDTTMDGFNDLLSSGTAPLATIASGVLTTQFVNNSSVTTDRMVASFYEMTYPRLFNFGGKSNFYFELPARAGGYLLNITNFNAGAAVPVLYDITGGQRYQAIVGSGVLTFLLPSSTSTHKFILVSEDPSNITQVGGLTTKNFVNFTNAANQGNYIIISNPILYTGSSGNNPVVDYKNYRSSAAGGGFNATVVDINELVDQFAFGIKMHPLSIKNFLRYARKVFASKPQYCFLIGHGLSYDQADIYHNFNLLDNLHLVPTFGYPASDNKLSSEDGVQTTPLTPIGRLSVVNGTEIEGYLAKVIEYESLQKTAANTIDGRLWMKNVVHVTGASDPYLGSVLCNYMNSYQQIIQDTLFGASVTTFCNSNAQVGDITNAQQLVNLFSSGLSILNYFGHSSAATLQDNLDDPSNYNNPGKYPVFYVNGCNAGNFFLYDPGRFANSKTLSELWVLAKERGSVAFIASTHFGIVNYLNILLNGLYTDIGINDYGKSIGIIQQDAVQNLVNVAPGDYYARLHAEEMTLHGDPALKLNQEALPDYDVEASQVSVSPTPVSITDASFTINARFSNLGKVVSDSITILVKRQYPDGTSVVVLKKRIPGIRYQDSVQVTIPIVSTRDKGQNTITVIVNSDNNVPEVTTVNNTVNLSVFIYDIGATPIYPYDYAIVTRPNQKLYASTANPLSPMTQYVMQIDTTTQFNSPLMVSKFVSSVGGVLEFDPGISFQDSVVYYWRTSAVPAQGASYLWGSASFIYIDSLKSTQGFNQSHYFQHLESTYDSMSLGADRKWKFGSHYNNLYLRNAVYPNGGTQDANFSVSVNTKLIIYGACLGQSLIFNVFDPVTFKPWKNVDANGNPLRLYGSAAVCGLGPNGVGGRQNNFEYSYMSAASRKLMMDFMDSIPVGYYVTVWNVPFNVQWGNTYAKDWEADTALYGSNNSLYHRLLSAGFLQIDSFYQPRAFSFVYKKEDLSFKPVYQVTNGIYDRVALSANCESANDYGFFTSPKFGPAKAWKQLHWRGSSLENPSTDSVGVQIIGLDTLGNSTVLYNLGITSQDFDISSISAQQYPYLQLRLVASDSVHLNPYQLQYWRLNYDPVPEGALAPNLFLKSQDTLAPGQTLQFGIAFKNVSITAFDSMRINVSITDHNNVTHLVQLPRKRPIVSGDTLMITYQIDTKSYPGMNTLFLDVNPNNAQPEQYHFNNFIYKNFYVKVDNTKPLLDVTFDGVHILNQDIVSARPHITIKLKDESKYALLTDTSLVKVQLRYPDGSLHPYSFSSDTLRFTPATNTADNTATVDFYPSFLRQYNPEGDVYTLVVSGKDASGNPAGTTSYQVSFTVVTKAMISNMLNYPNPFTTSTAFVFTITGSQVPQNIKIQILTITGKIIKEITEDELGPLHVGRNITEYKWNGTDQYGQRVANGVYLYHVVTNLNGKSLDKYTGAGDNTNQYFVKGYGKMYLMR